jgi:hypothetical protein
MESILKRLIPTLSIIVIRLTITAILIISHFDTYAVRGYLYTCAANIRKDTADGSLGWNLNGNETVFTINESCYLENDSPVLVNIKEDGNNFESCNVVFFSDHFFEVSCNNFPTDGSELHYLVLVLKDVIGKEITNKTIIPEELVDKHKEQKWY